MCWSGGFLQTPLVVSAPEHLHHQELVSASTLILLCVHVCISQTAFLDYFCLQDIVIQQDDEIRLRIVGTRVDAKDIVST